MRSSLRFHAICVLCIFTAQQSLKSASASDVLYVFSTPNKIQAPVELIRMEGNDIVSRIPLGFSVARGASRSRLVTFGVHDRKVQLKTWDLKSGTLLSDVEIKDLKVPYTPVFIGVADGLVVNDADNQVAYVGIQAGEPLRSSQRGRGTPPATRVSWFVVVDLSTGESHQTKPPKGALPGPQWSMVRGKLGTRLENGSFAIYSGESHSFGEVIEIEGIAKEWNAYFPNIGLVKESKDGWQILSDDNLAPLDRPIEIDFEAGSEKMRGLFRMANGNIGRWSVVRAGDDASVYIVHDVTSNSEVTKVRYPLAATTVFHSEEGSRLLLVDEKRKKALWANSASAVTSTVDFSWASLPYLLPVFEK